MHQNHYKAGSRYYIVISYYSLNEFLIFLTKKILSYFLSIFFTTNNCNNFENMCFKIILLYLINKKIYNVKIEIYYLIYLIFIIIWFDTDQDSKKIADDKNIDLTMPEYNPRLVKKMYNFKGEM